MSDTSEQTGGVTATADDVRSMAVIGAGTMGSGIALVAAASGLRAFQVDVSADQLERAKASHAKILARNVEKERMTKAEADEAAGRISYHADMSEAAETDWAVEAATENADLKKKIFWQMLEAFPDHAVLATNTSSISITDLAAGLEDQAARVIGMHFFNPVHIMKLLEVVVHPLTSDHTRERVLEIARALGKEPIVVRDSPGFASSRLGVVLGLEAMRMVEDEVASAEDIDKAMELGYKHPMGPLRLTDLVGLDVRLPIAEALHRELGGAQYQPPQILRDKVARGELGKKSNKGFYPW